MNNKDALSKLVRHLAEVDKISNGGAVLSDSNSSRREHIPVADALRAIKDMQSLNTELTKALKQCASVLSGGDMTKRSLVNALESAQVVLRKIKESE